MSTTKPKDWETIATTVLTSILRIAWFAAQEAFDGFRRKKYEYQTYILPGIYLSIVLLFKIDKFFAWALGLKWLELSFEIRQILLFTTLASGFVIWPVKRAVSRTKLLQMLRETFLYCKLEANRKLPAFIEDKPIDDHVRCLRLITQGIPKQKFLDQRESLEAMLNISVVKIENEGGDKGRINIFYAIRPLQTEALLTNGSDFRCGDIPIGVSYEGPISVNLPDIAHLLIAGQTGGGKSNFEKVVATTLVENNPEADVYYLDFKGGMELADLTNRLGSQNKNFFKYEGSRACTTLLSSLGEKIEERLQQIAGAGASSLEDYQKKLKANLVESPQVQDENPENIRKKSNLKRTYIIIDEIAQLYARDPSSSKDDLEKARAAVNRIARQGRAAGIHLIVATQKPDAQNFDQTVKSNLPAVLCFPMPSQAASVSAIGSKRAFDLNPEIRGRAVFKYGPQVTEVQTYLFQ